MIGILSAILLIPRTIFVHREIEEPLYRQQLSSTIREFLESKNSPLAPETDLLMSQEHWRLLIAISAIESQYCIKQLGFNCWGVGGDSAYRKYSSVRAAIVDANDLIEHWQNEGRWLTVEDMNCHYVQPCNENWVRVVKQVLSQIESYERNHQSISQQSL